jgi:cell division protein FtsZ
MEDSAAPETVVPVAGNEELMAMSEFIRNLDVSFEIVSPCYDFLLQVKRSTAVNDKTRTGYFFFDLPVQKPQPIQKVEENNAYAEWNVIKVTQPVEFVTEVV